MSHADGSPALVPHGEPSRGDVPGLADTLADRPGTAGQDAVSGLFGRGLLFPAVAALPLLTATIVSPVLAHRLGSEEFGLLAAALALHQVLTVVAAVGLDQALVLQRAEDRSDSAARGLIATGMVIAAAVSLVVGLTAPAWSRALGFPGVDALVLATVLWTAPAVTAQLALALLLGQDRLRSFAVVSLCSSVGGQVVGLALVLLLDGGAAVYGWGGVVGQSVAMLAGVVLARPDFRRVLDRPVVARALATGVPLAFSTLSVLVLDVGDRLVIQRTLGAAETGRYQVAYVIGIIAVAVLNLVGQSWSARIADVRDERARVAVIGSARDALYGLFCPMVLGIVLAAPLLLRVFAPADFRPATLLPVVFVVILSGIPFIATLAATRALVAARRTRPLAVAAATAAVVNIGLNVVVVPRSGLVGAAAVTFGAFCLQAALLRFSLPAEVSLPRLPPGRIGSVLAVVAVAGLTLSLPQSPAWIAGRSVLAVLCLPWLYLALRRARTGPGPS